MRTLASLLALLLAADATAQTFPPLLRQWLSTNAAPLAISVVAEGADPTGNADSTTAFTNAVWHAVHSTTNAIFVPPGYYKITNAIDLLTYTNGDATFAGAVSVIGAGARLVTIEQFGNTNGLQCEGISPGGYIGPVIRGITLLAHNGLINTNTQYGIKLSDVMQARIDEVNLLHWRYSAIYWTNVWVSALRNVYLLSNGDATHPSAWFSHCFENSWDEIQAWGNHSNLVGTVAFDTCISFKMTGGDVSSSGVAPGFLFQELVPSGNYCDSIVISGISIESPGGYYYKMGHANTNQFIPGVKNCVFTSVLGTTSGTTNIIGGVLATNVANCTWDRSAMDFTGSPATNIVVFDFGDGSGSGFCQGNAIFPAHRFSLATNLTYVTTNGVVDTSASITQPWYQVLPGSAAPAASPFSIGDGTASARLYLNHKASSTNDAEIVFLTANNFRWSIGVQGNEGVGDDKGALRFTAYDAGGNFIGWPLIFSRLTGIMTNWNITVTSNFQANAAATFLAPPTLITNAAPVDATTVKRWFPVTNGAAVYLLPSYQ